MQGLHKHTWNADLVQEYPILSHIDIVHFEMGNIIGTNMILNDGMNVLGKMDIIRGSSII